MNDRKYTIDYITEFSWRQSARPWKIGPFTSSELFEVISNFSKRPDVYKFEIKTVSPMQEFLASVT